MKFCDFFEIRNRAESCEIQKSIANYVEVQMFFRLKRSSKTFVTSTRFTIYYCR